MTNNWMKMAVICTQLRSFARRVVLKDEVEDLKRMLELEKTRSCYWRCVAKGEYPFIVATKEDREYIMG